LNIRIEFLFNCLQLIKTCAFSFWISKTNLLRVQPKYTRGIQEKNTQQDQEQGKKAQKSTKLETSRKVLT